MLLVFFTLLVMFLIRIYFIMPSREKEQKSKTPTVLCVLGSGGQFYFIFLKKNSTTEMISLLEEMMKEKPRNYIFMTTEERSKNYATLKLNLKEHPFLFIPRSRNVHQSYFTSIFSTLHSFMYTLWYLPPCDLLLCNGPGVCIPVVFSVYFYKFFLNWKTKILFIESIARVENLSLTGKILYYLNLTDTFLVQWEFLLKFKNVKYVGRLL
jgi:beta-1,4-N-acetylglucosaminyltransferase